MFSILMIYSFILTGVSIISLLRREKWSLFSLSYGIPAFISSAYFIQLYIRAIQA